MDEIGIYDQLLARELGYASASGTKPLSFHSLYGSKRWVEQLDIVNELEGHNGCVNALSWSRSGKLLASGSDDMHVNIHEYLPDSSTSQFQYTTTIATGHRANIFSVKFMPHSNDRTIVSAAGDHEVRIFDIEYAGQTVNSTTAGAFRYPSHRLSSGSSNHSVRHLSEADTHAKVFSSHGDRVKRIVTENSPFFFLTCSEDGEVRQWDVRQPSSAYPSTRGASLRRLSSSATGAPPPLISYKKFNLDLNSISCSPSQPHYIALGGAHLHCFLHDRRMLRRDRSVESGVPPSSSHSASSRDESLMNQATRCVKKFAPNGKQKMRRNDTGHITACKISDANPNELIVSWSGDYIYNFDINRTPDADETVRYTKVDRGESKRTKNSNGLKRKREKAESSVSREEAARAGSRPHTESAEREDQEMALMVQYQNGQSEEIPIATSRAGEPPTRELLRDAESLSYRIATSTVRIRKSMFTLNPPKPVTDTDPTGHATQFTSVLGFCGSILPEMDELMRSWRYPVDPTTEEIEFQNCLREDRGSSRRLVQASGTLARMLGGKLRMGGSSDAMIDQYFTSIKPVPNERSTIPRHEQFGYDFLKAIMLWLDSGIGALVEGFSASRGFQSSPRFPVPADEVSEEALHDIVIPYLLDLASDEPIINVDSSRFEIEGNRIIFTTEKAAVLSFAQVLQIPFADLSSAVVPASESGPTSSSSPPAQSRKTALKFWAFKVGSGILMNAAKDVNFGLVDRAFGGMGRGDAAITNMENDLTRRFARDLEEEESIQVQQARLVTRERSSRIESGSDDSSAPREGSEVQDDEDDEDEEIIPLEDLREAAITMNEFEGSDENDEDMNDDNGDDLDDSSDENRGGSEDESENDSDPPIFWRSRYQARIRKEKVETHVPCGTHTRVFKGHCNVRTVKDVNYYGLDDEYVVSGSDSGHLFIWEKKTGKLLNILEGDGEVVNVATPHPYEPMLAVSGIDHTVKIFSPDSRARFNARMGLGVTAADAAQFSSVRTMRRRRGRENSTSQPGSGPLLNPEDIDPDSDDETYVSREGLPSKRRIEEEYQITSQNDSSSRGGAEDVFVTQDMLIQLAAHLRERAEAGDEVDPRMLLRDADGECNVM